MIMDKAASRIRLLLITTIIGDFLPFNPMTHKESALTYLASAW